MRQWAGTAGLYELSPFGGGRAPMFLNLRHKTAVRVSRHGSAILSPTEEPSIGAEPYVLETENGTECLLTTLTELFDCPVF
jgi:hypothetical protein